MRARPAKTSAEKATEDKLQAEATRAAADGIAAQLKNIMAARPDIRVRDLRYPELDKMATGAISAWVLKRAAQTPTERFHNDPLPDFLA
jgi:hypothetical protein